MKTPSALHAVLVAASLWTLLTAAGPQNENGLLANDLTAKSLMTQAMNLPPIPTGPLVVSLSARKDLSAAVAGYVDRRDSLLAREAALGEGQHRLPPDILTRNLEQAELRLARDLLALMEAAPSSTAAASARLILARELRGYTVQIPVLAAGLAELREKAPQTWQASLSYLYDDFLLTAEAPQVADDPALAKRLALTQSRQLALGFLESPRAELPEDSPEAEAVLQLVGGMRVTKPLRATMLLVLANREYMLAQMEAGQLSDSPAGLWRSARESYERVRSEYPDSEAAAKAARMLAQVERYERHGVAAAPVDNP